MHANVSRGRGFAFKERMIHLWRGRRRDPIPLASLPHTHQRGGEERSSVSDLSEPGQLFRHISAVQRQHITSPLQEGFFCGNNLRCHSSLTVVEHYLPGSSAKLQPQRRVNGRYYVEEKEPGQRAKEGRRLWCHGQAQTDVGTRLPHLSERRD